MLVAVAGVPTDVVVERCCRNGLGTSGVHIPDLRPECRFCVTAVWTGQQSSSGQGSAQRTELFPEFDAD